MRRTFEVSAHVAPHMEPPPRQTLATFDGPLSAARSYAAAVLSGYDVIPGGRIDAPRLWRFEAINYTAQLGAVLWVRET